MLCTHKVHAWKRGITDDADTSMHAFIFALLREKEGARLCCCAIRVPTRIRRESRSKSIRFHRVRARVCVCVCTCVRISASSIWIEIGIGEEIEFGPSGGEAYVQ